jgi:hypothetical protein
MAAATKYNLLTASDRPFRKLVATLSTLLPPNLATDKAVRKLVFNFILDPTPITHSELRASYRSLLDNNTITNLIAHGIVARGVDSNYRLTSSFTQSIPFSLIIAVHKQYLTNFATKIAKLTSPTIDMDTFLGLIQPPSTYTLTDPAIKLTPLAADLLQHGTLSSNYMARTLLSNVQRTLVEELATVQPDTLDNYLKSKTHTLIHKLATIYESTSTILTGDILHHIAPLRVSYTGRFYETDNLGTTGLSKKIKAENYELISKILDQPIVNYDLRASQLAAILSYGKQYGVEFPAISLYVHDKANRGQLAAECNLPISLFKQLVLILLFGGQLDGNSVRDAFTKHGIVDRAELAISLRKFRTTTTALRADLTTWYSLALTIRPTLITNSIYLTNNVTTVPMSLIPNKRKLSAFLLQGMEASFILNLINLSKWSAYNFHFLSYEFDGLITLGSIPAEAITRAMTISGFSQAILEPKAIA